MLVVLVLQLTSKHVLGFEQIYANNDLTHFIKQMFLASNWSPTEDSSVNGPVWSISLEILVYALFWVSSPFLYRFGVAGPGALAAVDFVLMRLDFPGPNRFWDCCFYFFSGTVIGLLYTNTRRYYRLWLLIGLAIGGIGYILRLRGMLLAIGLAMEMVGFLVVACTLESTRLKRWAKKAAWIGDNTYSSYLWHVPLQIVTLIFLDAVLKTRAPVSSPFFFVGYIVIVSVISRLSYLYIENPMRGIIRKHFERTKPTTLSIPAEVLTVPPRH